MGLSEVYEWFEKRGFKPTLHRMDNKTSAEVEHFIAEQNTNVKYTVPEKNNCAPEKKAVQTFKSCFKSTTVSLPPEFPISYWCRLLTQVDLCVNSVRPCRQNPTLLLWAAVLEGDFHFNSTPIAPPGTVILIYKRPENRMTCGHNVKKSWYTGPRPECLTQPR